MGNCGMQIVFSTFLSHGMIDISFSESGAKTRQVNNAIIGHN